ncbi:MAG: Na+/H+ antiporter NhaA [Alphaproteobacteria bacterium]|nr:Na+/H+ antiporter NhaA [Alphaproteobacteria bacterium]MCB1550586.1 Na+/H+ antiporter NhaA [Alphaproteobacteria bacterium]MCB9985451.1 Na+/H+ antiporter NhaA [Micavibrio sp.]
MAREFFKMEASGGVMLVVAAILALVVANTSLYPLYDFVLNKVNFTIGFVGPEDGGPFLDKSVLHWINDGLMAVFFFLVGLEIKREVLRGELSSFDKALLPILMAIGGVAIPSAIYFGLNMQDGGVPTGWAVPAATDIAFSLGILALLGSRAPISLKITLTAIAIIDDLMAILIIAFFYSGGLSAVPLLIAGLAVLGLLALNQKQVVATAPYVLVGFVLWVALLKSGMHPTIGGVLTAFAIPLSCVKRPWLTPVETLEHALHPWVAYMILPLFAFANAGVSFEGMGLGSFTELVTLGIIAGLFIGKQLGIFLPLFLAVKSGLCKLPDGASWGQVYGMSVLCGVGFTMSLFIGELAFDDPAIQSSVRLGVLSGSVLSAVVGYAVIRFCPKKGT